MQRLIGCASRDARTSATTTVQALEPMAKLTLLSADNEASIASLRQEMALAGNLDAYIVPSEDPHMSEYPPDCCARRVYISGFTGSAGTAVITKDKALLWTDGRYFLQAEKELSKSWTLMRMGQPGTPDVRPSCLSFPMPIYCDCEDVIFT